MTNETLLNNAINACEKIKNYYYEIIIGKNGKESSINLIFKNESFYHMLGLHKLTDIYEFRKSANKERQYLNLVSSDKLRKKVINSPNVDLILPRLRAIVKLEEILDKNKEQYYDKNNYYHSMDGIDYDYAIHYKESDYVMSFYFIKNIDLGNDYLIVSNFEQQPPKNQHCRRPHTLLVKYKVNISDKSKVCLYKK